MFPFRHSRAVTALLELAEAMLAPEAFEHDTGDRPRGQARHNERAGDATHHPHRRGAAIDVRRRPAPPHSDQACLAPLTRAGRARETQRAA